MITRIPTKTRMLEKIPFIQPKTYSKVIIKNYKKQLGFRLYWNDDTFGLKEERSGVSATERPLTMDEEHNGKR